jgi:hypothetical protein
LLRSCYKTAETTRKEAQESAAISEETMFVIHQSKLYNE